MIVEYKQGITMKEKVDFIKIVRHLLESQTQMELSEKTGVHQGVISELNRGIEKPKLSYTYGTALELAYKESLASESTYG